MSSPQILTLFAEPRFPRRSYSLAISLLFHGAGGIALSLGMLGNPPVIQGAVDSLYPVHLIRLDAPIDSEDDSLPYTPPMSWHGPRLGDGRDADARKNGISEEQRAIQRAQILLQSSASAVQPYGEVAPSLMIIAEKPIDITPMEEPSRKKVAPPGVRPMLELPNGESLAAELNVTSSHFFTDRAAILSGATTPIAIAASPGEELPGMFSDSTSQAAFARIVSISDLRVASGTVVLPEIRIVPSAISLGDGPQGGLSAGGGSGPSKGGAGASGPARGWDSSAKRIVFPRDGHYPVVLIGESVQEAYPEVAGIWSGRLVYTVYLPIDAGKRWILQYSLSKANQAAGIVSGGRPEAPWPLDILVPTLDAQGAGLGTVIVLGSITTEGHIGGLTVAFPPQFPHAEKLLDPLKKWIFRPALQKGRPVELEFLLIIPGTE